MPSYNVIYLVVVCVIRKEEVSAGCGVRSGSRSESSVIERLRLGSG